MLKAPRNTKPQKLKGSRSSILKNVFLYGSVILILLLVFSSLYNGSITTGSVTDVPLSQAIKLLKNGEVRKIEVDGDFLSLEGKDGKKYGSRKESGAFLTDILRDNQVDSTTLDITIKNPELNGGLFDLLINILPVVLMIGFFYLLFRQARGGPSGPGGESIFTFGKSRAKEMLKGEAGAPKITFKDVAGVEDAEKELQEVVQFLSEPEKFRKLGARIPKGVLIVGPAGVGKTLLAKALAGEAKVPFFAMAGSEFMEMLVGVGASRVRDLFETAKKSAPSIIFIDEIESIGRQRGAGFMGGHEEREQTLNQILVEMDGFSPNTSVIVVAATNRPDLLDPALIRPGRFDRRVVLDYPDVEGRKAILKIHMRGKPLAPGVDVDKLAKRTVGFSGADLENTLNEAAISAARADKKVIEEIDLEDAATKVKLGPEKRRLQTDKDKRVTAYHEAGHAIVASNLPNMDPVHRISIVSRGMALGFTMIPPSQDRYNETKTRLLEQITSLLGGRSAEELVFDEITVGASSDIAQATAIARKMVTEYGMSSLGPVNLGDGPSRNYFTNEDTGYSDEMAGKIDLEVSRIINDCHMRAKSILEEKRSILDKIAATLIDKETLEGEEYLYLIKPEISVG